MANNAFTQQALANEPHFRTRFRAMLARVAWAVVDEADTVANHDSRLAYAQKVLRSIDTEVSSLVQSFVMRPNVFAFETTYDFDFVTQSGRVVTAAGDPDIESQLTSDWNTLAGVSGYQKPKPVIANPPLAEVKP